MTGNREDALKCEDCDKLCYRQRRRFLDHRKNYRIQRVGVRKIELLTGTTTVT